MWYSFVLLRVVWLKLRTAIDGDTGACDPARPIGGDKSDYVGDVFGFADSLKRLHPQSGLATRFSLSEVRHIRADHTGRDRIYADTLGPQNGSPVLDQSL